MAPPPHAAASSMGVAAHYVTEDTPPDLFEGCMDLLVLLPNQKRIAISVERKMPVMDLLVHVTTSNKISPGSHVLQITDFNGMQLPYKPSTSIGSLNAHNVYVIPKNRLNEKLSGAQQPFEPTCRLQVRLPRNQLCVVRVNPRTPLGDVLKRVCQERSLEPAKYELRHPVNLDERLRLSCSLSDYKLQEVVLVPSGLSSAGSLSVSDLPAMKKSSSSLAPLSKKASKSPADNVQPIEKKRSKGFLGFMFGKKRSSVGDSSLSSESVGDRSLSPSHSDDSPAAAASPPSPVFISKVLAQEAAVKRSSRSLTHSSGDVVSSSSLANSDEGSHAAEARGAALEFKLAARQKKRPAPLPPPAYGNDHRKAESIVSSCSSSSESTAVSLPASVVLQSIAGSDAASDVSSGYHESNSSRRSAEPPVVLRAKKLDKQSPRSQSVINLASSGSGNAPSSRGNHSSLSNLTQINSASETSLSAALKKRKAPAPPPVESKASVAAEPAVDVAAAAAAEGPPPALAVEEAFQYLDQVLQDASSKTDNDDNDDSYEEVDFGPTVTRHPVKEEVLTDNKLDLTEPVYAVVIKKPKAEASAPSENVEKQENSVQAADSPIMWEYKLPDPPVVTQIGSRSFQPEEPDTQSEHESLAESQSIGSEEIVAVDDSGIAQLDTEGSDQHSRDSGVAESTTGNVAVIEESNFHAKLPETVDEVKVTEISTVVQIDTAELETARCGGEQSVSAEIVQESQVAESGVTITLVCGSELLQESGTEDQQELVLTEDPDMKGFGKESTTDEVPVSPEVLEVSPEVAGVVPEVIIRKEERPRTKFSISSYSQRIELDGVTYEKKLSRSESMSVSTSSRQNGGFSRPLECARSESINFAKLEKSSVGFSQTVNFAGSWKPEPVAKKLESVDVKTESIELKAELIEKRSESIDRESESIEGNSELIEKKSKGIEKKAESIEEKSESFENKPESIDKKVESIEKKLDLIAKSVSIEKKAESIEEKSESIEKKTESIEKKTESASADEDVKQVLPVLSFIEEAKAFLQSAPDPRAKMLEEEFLRLQQQFLMWQQQQLQQQQQPELQQLELQQQNEQLQKQPDPQQLLHQQPELLQNQQLQQAEPQLQQQQPEPPLPQLLQQQQPELKQLQQQPEPQHQLIQQNEQLQHQPEHHHQQLLQQHLQHSDVTAAVQEAQQKFLTTTTLQPIPQTTSSTEQHVSLVYLQEALPEKTPEKEENRSPNSQEQRVAKVELPQKEYRYQGPPQIKLDTWKPGRPAPEVIDLSREPSFAVPDLRNVPAAREIYTDPSRRSSTESAVSAKVAAQEAAAPSPRVEDQTTGSATVVTRVSVLTRKASIDAPRPFQLQTYQGIKRPSLQFTTSRAPQVRGFANIPDTTVAETQQPVVADLNAEQQPQTSRFQKMREQLIASARKPSAETALKTEDPQQLKGESVVANPLERPLKMPTSSSLLLAATKQSEALPTPPPPPAPIVVVKKKVQTKRLPPVVQADPREQLLSAIRNFGAGSGLKKTGVILD